MAGIEPLVLPPLPASESYHDAANEEKMATDFMTMIGRRLLLKLCDFLEQEDNLHTITIPALKDDLLESLVGEVGRMDAELCHILGKEDVVDLSSVSIQARELSYGVEDIVDNILLCIMEGFANSQYCSRETLLLQDIKAQCRNLAAWSFRGGSVAKTTSMTTLGTAAVPCLEDTYKQVRPLVGIHHQRDELISRMSSSSQRDVVSKNGLKIVSICGVGGIGKTTLAKAVYDNIKGDFHCRAFVSVGRRPNLKKVMMDILINLGKERYRDLNMARMGDRQLIDELRDFLKTKRYLIVIDDIWDIHALYFMKLALIDSGCGSRIIVTSRDSKVGTSGEVCLLKPLGDDDTMELFYATLVGRNGTFTYDSLHKECAEDILRKCDGVPLSIIAIASLLAGKAQEEWLNVNKSIGEHKDPEVGNADNIVSFCYKDLPSHLKASLLYLSIFPEDHVIEKDLLVWRWVAEGFVQPDKEQGGESSLFKVGERYLCELIDRGMIQAVENEENSICACRVHDLVHDLIRGVASKEGFVAVLDSSERHGSDTSSSPAYSRSDSARLIIRKGSGDARRVAIQNKILESQHLVDLDRLCIQRVRSFNGTGCRVGASMISVLAGFEVLRVLSLEDCTADDWDGLMKNIAGLLHLRYLGLRGTNIGDLPTEIGGLRFLQTLDLRDTYIEALPPGVTQLRQLRCLRCFSTGSFLDLPPQGIGNLTSLEDLWLGTIAANKCPDYFGRELSKLTELRVLRLRCYYNMELWFHGWKEGLVDSLSKLQKVEELVVICHGPGSDEPWYHAVAPGAFPRLRRFEMNTWLMNQPGAMPCLKSLDLSLHVRAFIDDAKIDLNDLCKLFYLRFLEKARVQILCWGATVKETEEAEAALRRVFHKHPNRPMLALERFGSCADEEQWRPEDYSTHINRDNMSAFSHMHIHSLGYTDKLPVPLELLRIITKGFSRERQLGAGAFGTVYKASE